jgi:hypothetical protein
VIIVVGSPVVGPETLRPARRAAGLAVGVALAARQAGAQVELVGKVGDDPAGDALVVELEREGIGHAALLRDPASTTPRRAAPSLALSREDVDLALRYLTEARVIVTVGVPRPDVAEAVAEAARYASAHLVLIDEGDGGAGIDTGHVARSDASSLGAATTLDAATTRLRAPARDDGAFAQTVGEFAAAIDRGDDPPTAFRRALDDVGWQPTAG